jgi:hypothetical protein
MISTSWEVDTILPGVDVLLGPAHLGDVDQAFDARLKLHEGAVLGDVGHAAGEGRADGVFHAHGIPRIGLQLLHAQGDPLGLLVDLDDLHVDGLADLDHLGRMADAAPAHVGDVQQAVDAAQVHERAVIGDVLDHAFAQAGDQLGALLGAGFFEDGPARDDDVAPRTVHLQDGEGLFLVHQRADVAHGADVHLRARQEGRRAAQIHREAALDAADDGAGDRLLGFELLLQTVPGLLAARLVARQDGLAHGVLDALEEDLDFVAGLGQLGAGAGEFTQGDAAFGLQADIDHHVVVLDGGHLAFDDGAFHEVAAGEARFQHFGEIITAGGSGHVLVLLQGSGF